MGGQVRIWFRVGLLVLLLATLSGLVHADGGGTPADPRLPTRAALQNPEDFQPLKENNPSGSAVVEAVPSLQMKWLNWAGDHAMGLGIGLLVGVGVGFALVVVGSILAISAPVLAVAAVGAAVSGALYGLFTGLSRFNVLDCVVQSFIGGVSAGMGFGLGSAGILAGRTLLAAKFSLDVVAGGLASMASYLVQTPDPSVGGAMASFGAGAGAATLFFGLGYGLAKLRLAWRPAKGLGKATEAAAEATPATQPAAKAASPAASSTAATARRPRRSTSASAGANAPDPIKDLAKAPASVRKLFTEALESGSAAERQQALNAHRDGVAKWAKQNPLQSNALAESGAGLPGLVEAAREAPKWRPRDLEANMTAKFGLSKPNRYAVHHIVAGNDPDAERARMLLQRLKIDINDADNGVYLPNERGVGTTEAYHPTLHTKDYHRNVYLRISKATDEAHARDILAEIAQELTTGTFPK